jgi:hypothetical protein
MHYRKCGYKIFADTQEITALPVSEANAYLCKATSYDVYTPAGTHFNFMDKIKDTTPLNVPLPKIPKIPATPKTPTGIVIPCEGKPRKRKRLF